MIIEFKNGDRFEALNIKFPFIESIEVLNDDNYSEYDAILSENHEHSIEKLDGYLYFNTRLSFDEILNNKWFLARKIK